jgi:hypothetical protein
MSSSLTTWNSPLPTKNGVQLPGAFASAKRDGFDLQVLLGATCVLPSSPELSHAVAVPLRMPLSTVPVSPFTFQRRPAGDSPLSRHWQRATDRYLCCRSRWGLDLFSR